MCHGSNCQAAAESSALLLKLGCTEKTYKDERSQDVQAERGKQGDNDVTEDGVTEEIRD